MTKFVYLTSELGIALTVHKCTTPAQSLTWLGFVLNTIDMKVTIPLEKISELLLKCISWKKKCKASHKRRQTLLGKIKDLAKCIKPASGFSNSLSNYS